MNYQQIQPPPHLSRYVRYFWVLETDSVGCSSKTFRPISDGCPGILYQPAEAGTCYDQAGKQLPPLFLYGQTIQHRELHTSGRFNALGVCFYPYALKSVFGLDANELADTCADVNLVAGKSGFCLSEQLLNAPSPTHQIDRLSAYLTTLIKTNNVQQDSLTEYALAQFINSRGNISLKELQEVLRVSERSFERRFRQRVGISPKLFSRICRFQASLTQLRTTNYEKLSDIAFENGYADQSHFIRAFKEFAGFSPHQYRKQSGEVVQNLAQWRP